MTAAKKAASKKEAAPATPPATASPESPAPPLVASLDQLNEAAHNASDTKKKG